VREEQDSENEARHRALNEFTTMAEAVLMAHYATASGTAAGSDLRRNTMAATLAKVVQVFSLSEDRQTVRPLSAAELRGGSFIDGGRVITFQDGREPITGIAVTRRALKAAIQLLTTSNGG
jgi:hypothetical protein